MIKNILFLFALALVVSAQWRLQEEAFDNNSLQPSDLEGWSFDNVLNGNELTNCGELSIIGGYQSAGKGALLYKTFSDFPEHYKVKVSVSVFFVDSWDNESFVIKANGQEVMREASTHSFHTPMCGSASWGERVATLEVEFAHSSGDLTMEFSSTLNQAANDESWGVRDFQIYILKCDKGCEIVDEQFQGDFTEDDVIGWTGSRDIADGIVTDCDGHKLVGGYNKFGQKFQYTKQLEDLPEHYKIVIAFQLWQIDSWDGNDFFRVTIDGKAGYSSLKKSGAYGGSYECGHGSFSDEASDVTIEVPHFADSITITLEDKLNEGVANESWGFRDFRVYAIQCEDDCNVISKELQETSFSGEDVTGWFNGDAAYDTVTACTRVSMVGGYNELAGATISKTFTDLPPHSSIMVGLEVWFIDSWDKEDFTLAIDQVSGLTTTKSKGDWAVELGNVCGGGQTEEIQFLWVEQPHFSDKATISLISELNQAASDESWGFREFHLYVKSSPDVTQQESSLTENPFTETSDWTITDPVSEAITSECAGKTILGGYNTFSGSTHVSRTFTELPAHDFVVINFKAYFIDSWDKEAFLVQIDGTKRKQLTKKLLEHLASVKLCGKDQYEDFIYNVDAQFEHSDSTLLLEIFTMLDQVATDESWGIRDFHLSTGQYIFAGPDCPTIYSECNYEGESFNLCDDVPDFTSVDWSSQVYSVWVPEGWTATLYQNTEYDGEAHVFTESARCLEDGPQYNLIKIHSLHNQNKSHNLQKVNNLRVQKAAAAEVHHKSASHLKKNSH